MKKVKKNKKKNKSTFIEKLRKGNRPMIIYVLLVVTFSILFIILTNQSWFEQISNKILSGYSSISSSILNLFGQNTTSNGELIQSNKFSMQVKKGCDAIAPMILFIISIAFFPTQHKKKILGIILGIAFLAVLNIIRIVSLYFVGAYTNEIIFEIVHVDIWQIFFIVLTLFAWIYWLKISYLDKTKTDELG